MAANISTFVRQYLRLVNLVLIVVSAVFAYQTVRAFTTPRIPRERPPAAGTSTPAPVTTQSAKADADAGERYNVIATRNLFSASRTENPPAVASASTPVPKLILHGVVMLEEGRSRAFLEEGNSKKVGSYGIGDQVAGGRIETISMDRVVISRPDGRVEIKLHDAPTPQASASPAGTQTGGAAPSPAVRR